MKKQQYRKKILILGLVAGLVVPAPVVPAPVVPATVYDLPDTSFDRLDIDTLPTARLTVETEPADALVRNLSIQPAHKNGMALAPGTYRIEVSAQGYDTREEDITLKRGDNLQVKITLKPSIVVSPPPPPPPELDRTYTDTTTGMEFVYVPEGCFTLGDTFGEGDGDEKPDKDGVCVKAFYLGKYEVTQGQWQEIMGKNPSEFQKGDDYPVERVSWDDVQEFIGKLNRQSGKQYSLPSEAQWEYAASWRPDGSKARFGNGKDIADPAEINFDGRKDYKESYSKVGVYRRKTVPVDSFSPNALGLYNMSGNVWEWCQDRWHDSYEGGPKDGSAWESGRGSVRVIRGGSWYNYPRVVRAAARGRGTPGNTNGDLGFRLVLPVH